MSYKNMDWELEAKRIQIAFGADHDCEFVADFEHIIECMRIEGSNKEQDYEFDISYTPYDRKLWLFDRPKYRKCFVKMGWDGELKMWSKGAEDKRETFTRALFLLNLLTPEIAGLFDFAMPLHQKIKLKKEFEELVKQ